MISFMFSITIRNKKWINVIYGMGVAVMGVSHLLHGIAKGNHVKKNTYYTRKPFFQKKKKL